MDDRGDANSSPVAHRADTLHPPTGAATRSPSLAGRLLHNYLATMNACGDDAEAAYGHAVSAIRQYADDVVIEIARSEVCCGADDYPTKWALICAAAELHSPAAMPFFRSVVLTPLPPERGSDPHSWTVIQETVLRTTAVEGLARLAADGEQRAIESLFEFLEVACFSVKRAAVQALLKVPKQDLRGRIEEQLCPEDRFLLDVESLDVDRVKQIDNPEAFLSDAGRAAKPTAPDLPDRDRSAESA